MLKSAKIGFVELLKRKIRQFVNWFLTPPLRSSPCKGDRNAHNLVQSSPLFKGSTCGAGEGFGAN